MLLNESVSHNTAAPKRADRIEKIASANSTPLESRSNTAADASRQTPNPRCRAKRRKLGLKHVRVDLLRILRG